MSIGVWKLVLILLVVLIFFGAGRLPRVMGDIGRGIKSLKEGLKEEELPTAQMKDVSPTATAQDSSTKDSPKEGA